jgi:hypothetical protein
MQPNSFALNWRPNCLFKWQVIPTKQITPVRPKAYVVFLQQIVAAKELLIRFHGINLGYRRIEQSLSRMGIVSNIQSNLL